MTERYVSHAQARRIYDRIGRWQDTRPLSERRALDALVERAAFERAGAVLEFGCGTGRLAARLLAERLPAGARYLGLDVSPRMVGLARAAVAPWGDRARVDQAGGHDGPAGRSDGSFDRVVSTYVLDLLSPEDAARLLDEAHRVLRPGGLLALASLTPGRPRRPAPSPAPGRAVWRAGPGPHGRLPAGRAGATASAGPLDGALAAHRDRPRARLRGGRRPGPVALHRRGRRRTVR